MIGKQRDGWNTKCLLSMSSSSTARLGHAVGDLQSEERKAVIVFLLRQKLPFGDRPFAIEITVAKKILQPPLNKRTFRDGCTIFILHRCDERDSTQKNKKRRQFVSKQGLKGKKINTHTNRLHIKRIRVDRAITLTST